MSQPPVFYYDFNSPYAYMASERIDELIPDAEWRPFAYPILLHQAGRLEEVLGRDPSTIREIVIPRIEGYGLPTFSPPASWPFQAWSLLPLRAAAFAEQQGRLKQFTAAVFRAFFVEGRELKEAETIRDVAQESGLEPGEVAHAVERDEIKQLVKERTDEAIARGVSGIPTVAIGDELFWGDDRLDEAAAAARDE